VFAKRLTCIIAVKWSCVIGFVGDISTNTCHIKHIVGKFFGTLIGVFTGCMNVIMLHCC